MRVVDQALGWFLILLDCVHNFVAAPMTYAELSPPKKALDTYVDVK